MPARCETLSGPFPTLPEVQLATCPIHFKFEVIVHYFARTTAGQEGRREEIKGKKRRDGTGKEGGQREEDGQK
jgi:hypothetical protein